MIEVHKVNKKFGSQEILRNVDFDVREKERVIILGQNGAGKTTLLRCILGHYRLDSGSIRVNGYDPRKQRRLALTSLSYIPQLPPPMPFSIHSLVGFSVKTTGCTYEEVARFSEMFGLRLKDHSQKDFFKLSGGMKQKVLAAIAFARHSRVMLFDEPTANLDPDSREVFCNLVKSEEFKDSTMIFISHRIEELGDVLERAIWLDFGEVVKDEKLS